MFECGLAVGRARRAQLTGSATIRRRNENDTAKALLDAKEVPSTTDRRIIMYWTHSSPLTLAKILENGPGYEVRLSLSELLMRTPNSFRGSEHLSKDAKGRGRHRKLDREVSCKM